MREVTHKENTHEISILEQFLKKKTIIRNPSNAKMDKKDDLLNQFHPGEVSIIVFASELMKSLCMKQLMSGI